MWVCMIESGKRNVKFTFWPPAPIILSLKIINVRIKFEKSDLTGDKQPDFIADSLNEIDALF